jgi:mannose-6-phosphate isomerase-like protein (cupin superfamily)
MAIPQAQFLKGMVPLEPMGASDSTEAMSPSRVERPWGWFETLAAGPGYLLKRLCIRAGQRISLQRHLHRQEHWVVAAGSGWLEADGHQLACGVGSTFEVPRGSLHRATAADSDLLIIEVQLGELLSETDIERFADDYGRLTN